MIRPGASGCDHSRNQARRLLRADELSEVCPQRSGARVGVVPEYNTSKTPCLAMNLASAKEISFFLVRLQEQRSAVSETTFNFCKPRHYWVSSQPLNFSTIG